VEVYTERACSDNVMIHRRQPEAMADRFARGAALCGAVQRGDLWCAPGGCDKDKMAEECGEQIQEHGMYLLVLHIVASICRSGMKSCQY
jgi:hypothetical protein